MLETVAPFLMGLIGSLHCLGMCGPLVLAYSIHCRPATQAEVHDVSGVFLQHLAFHSGRIFTYGMLGAVVAGVFGSLEVQKFSMQYRGGITIVFGLLLLVLGLVLFRLIPLPGVVSRIFVPQSSTFLKKLGRMAASSNPVSKVGLGLSAGLIPCGMTWAMLVAAASTLAPVKGFVLMTSFGLGTLPLLLLTGISASFVGVRTRLLGEKVAAASIMGMGLILLVRGAAIISGQEHCGSMEFLLQSGLLK